MASALHQLHSCAHSYLSLQILYHGAVFPQHCWALKHFVSVRVDGHMANIKSQKEPGVGSQKEPGVVIFIDYSAVHMQNSVITTSLLDYDLTCDR